MNENILLNFIQEALPSGYEVALETINKNNRSLRAIRVTAPDINFSPVVYLSALKSTDEKSAALELLKIVETSMSHTDFTDAEKLIGMIRDRQSILDNVTPKLISIKGNEEYLSDKLYSIYMDLAVVYQVSVNIPEGTYSITLKKGITDIPIPELHEAALKNMAAPRIRSMAKVFADMSGGVYCPEIDYLPLYVCDTDAPGGTPGATVLLKPESFKELAEKLGGDLILLPSSIFEVLALPASGEFPIEVAKEMVLEVNAEEVSPEEKLADSVYLYSAAENTISLA